MKSQELLSQIKNLLGMENVQLEKLSLDNGTVLEAELFESGKEVFILSDDEKEKDEMKYVTKEEFRKEMDDLKKSIQDMMDNKDKEKDEMASQVATEVAVEMSSQEPASKPIKHSPENKESAPKFRFAKNRKTSTLDRVMETLIN